MRYYLLVDFGSTYTKLTAVDAKLKDIIATSKAITTVETDIHEGYALALADLEKQFSQPVTFDKIVACSSAAGGLKLAAIGLVPELTTEAAKRVCLGAGGKVELVFSHFINDAEIQKIKDKKIDIILLSGGTDGGNSESVIFNAEKLSKAHLGIPIIYAGNKSAQDEVIAIFKAFNQTYHICENVMPKLNELNIESASNQIKKVFLERIIEAKGIKKIENQIDRVILPTPNAVLIASELLSKGYLDEPGLGEIMLLDIGGATTDLYSMTKGLPTKIEVVYKGLEEPFAKRTVEGDLGMRYSALGVYEALTEEERERFLLQGIDLHKEAEMRNHDIAFVPKSDQDYVIESVFAGICADKAMSRHVGSLERTYTPFGFMYYQTGKDLSRVTAIIGTGGVVINAKDPQKILKELWAKRHKAEEARPMHTEFYLDQDYILSAMGLLSLENKALALHIMKKRIRLMKQGDDNRGTQK